MPESRLVATRAGVAVGHSLVFTVRQAVAPPARKSWTLLVKVSAIRLTWRSVARRASSDSPEAADAGSRNGANNPHPKRSCQNSTYRRC